ILCVQRLIGMASTGSALFVVMVTACLTSWVTGLVFGSVPVVYAWIRYDPAEMLCAVFWENSYSDIDDAVDLSSVSPLLVSFYMLCYTPFFVSELILMGRRDLSPGT
ncbi:hypothetical protein KUCAC02_015211, partial [Chaenocephalus aceratus]